MTREEILQKLSTGKMKVEQAAEALAALDKLNARPVGKVYFKVSRKGAISAYGLQRMPVTLYVEQWERLFGEKGEFEKFVKQWEGKDYKGEAALEQGGEKVPYTARIERKSAA